MALYDAKRATNLVMGSSKTVLCFLFVSRHEPRDFPRCARGANLNCLVCSYGWQLRRPENKWVINTGSRT